ncbi:hypothetical protein JCM10295v2_000540 [Rhodotorula toruloides]
MTEDARRWAVDGVRDARALPEALDNHRYLLILHHLGMLEQRRKWLLDTAEYVLMEEEQMGLSERDERWLEEVISQKNRDEGDIRFCAIDLSWRRLCLESCILAGDFGDARIALKANFTSDTSDRRKIYRFHPDGLQHLLAFASAYDAYIAKADATHKKGKKAFRWPHEGMPNDGKIDAELLVKMSKDWALCVLRQLRRMKKLLHQASAKPHLMRPEDQQSALASMRQSQSQDSLPTPGPSSNGFGAAATSAQLLNNRASPRKRQRNESPAGGGSWLPEGEDPVEETRVEVVYQAQETVVDMEVDAERVKTPEPPAIALDAAPSAFLAPPSPNDDAGSLPESQLPPTKPFPTDIFSLLAKGAAEQDQKLRSSRRMSEPAPPVAANLAPQQAAPPQPQRVEADMPAHPAKPAQSSRRAPPPATPLGPSASTILMPPPPTTSKSKGSTQSPAANVSITAPVAASSQGSVERSSAEPSTLPSDISAMADLSGESQAQSQAQPHGADDPPPDQHAADRSGAIPPPTSFTASQTASPVEVSFEAPTPAQGAKQLVPDTPESSAPLLKAVVVETEAVASVTLVSQSTQSTSSGSATSNHISDSQALLGGEHSGTRSVALVSSLETASSSQPNPFTQPILSTRSFTGGSSVQPVVNILMTAQAQTTATGAGSNSSQQSSFGSDTSGLTYLSHTEMERIREEALAAQRAKEAEAEERRKRAEREAAEEARRQAEREMLESQQDEASQGILGTDEDDDMSATASPAEASAEHVETDGMDVDEIDDDMPLSQAPETQAFPSTQADSIIDTTPEDGSPVKGRPRRRSFIEVESEAEDDDAPDVDDEAGGFLEFVNLDGNE